MPKRLRGLSESQTLISKLDGPLGDGFVNWLTTHLINALGHTSVTRTRARVAVHAGHEICRVDAAASPHPVWAKTSKGEEVFFVRMNNSTRALPEPDIEVYRAEHWRPAPS